MQATSDNVVALPIEVLDHSVSLSDLVDLRIPRVSEIARPRSFVLLVAGRLCLVFIEVSSSIKSAFLEQLTLHLLWCHLEAIIEVFGVENVLGSVGKFVAQEGALLVAVLLAHVVRIVYARSGATVERPIVLVKLVLLRGLNAVEPSLIGLEVGVVAEARVETMATRHRLV